MYENLYNWHNQYIQRCGECGRDFFQCNESGSDGAGVIASFILYVSAITYGPCPTTSGGSGYLAFASTCQLEDQFDRSVHSV